MVGIKSAADDKVAIVKKYANRRLYNTATSSYVTLDDLCKMVRAGDNFVVYDAKTGEDLTRSVLTQIILEEDAKGRNLLPINFLRQLIGFYDDNVRAFLPRYLEMSMENFARNQEQIRLYIEGTFGSFFPVGQFEDMARQNMALFQKAATMFNPVGAGDVMSETFGTPGNGTREHEQGADPVAAHEIHELNAKIEALEQQLQTLMADRRPENDESAA